MKAGKRERVTEKKSGFCVIPANALCCRQRGGKSGEKKKRKKTTRSKRKEKKKRKDPEPAGGLTRAALSLYHVSFPYLSLSPSLLHCGTGSAIGIKKQQPNVSLFLSVLDFFFLYFQLLTSTPPKNPPRPQTLPSNRPGPSSRRSWSRSQGRGQARV